ncbi:MAG: DeoR family transcriptional regulator [Rhizobiales bacterium]|nr:DeoR family transcriptional regulator [Hyphomicrobiales bacterium]
MEWSDRQTRILAALRQHGAIRIADLASDLDVSLETVRRDIRPLDEAGELIKLHGQVRLPAGLAEVPFERRMRENAEEKRVIARHVAAGIADGDSIMLDTGTTTSLLARALLGKRGLTIVTNSSDVARTLATVNGNKVYMAGGELHGDNGAAFGRWAIDFVARFRVRFAIISIGAVDAGVGPMDFHLEEAEFARTVLQCGEQRLIITDHTKFARPALVKVCDFSDFDRLVCDRPPPPEIADRLKQAGTEVELARL